MRRIKNMFTRSLSQALEVKDCKPASVSAEPCSDVDDEEEVIINLSI